LFLIFASEANNGIIKDRLTLSAEGIDHKEFVRVTTVCAVPELIGRRRTSAARLASATFATFATFF